jgi:hypothetical protein
MTFVQSSTPCTQGWQPYGTLKPARPYPARFHLPAVHRVSASLRPAAASPIRRDLPPLHPPAHRACGLAFGSASAHVPDFYIGSSNHYCSDHAFHIFHSTLNCVLTCVLSGLKLCPCPCILMDTFTGLFGTQEKCQLRASSPRCHLGGNNHRLMHPLHCAPFGFKTSFFTQLFTGCEKGSWL